MNRLSVVAYSAKQYDQQFLHQAIDNNINLKCYSLQLNAQTAVMAKDALVVSAFVNDQIDRDTLQTLAEGGTKLIALRCAGYNHVDLNAAVELGISVVNVPAYSPYAVAEHSIAMMLTLSRKLTKAYNRVRDGNFALNGLLGFDFYQKTVGIIGGGKIGLLVAERMHGFGCKVLIYEPYNPKSCQDLGYTTVELNELYQQSDIISLHCPLTAQTKHMINAAAINEMKPSVMLINTSRGGLMDSNAILNAMKHNQIGYLGIDVYEQEGSLFFDDHSSEIIQDDTIQLLISMPNVLVTGHQAYFTKEALMHISKTTMQNISDFVTGKALSNQVPLMA